MLLYKIWTNVSEYVGTNFVHFFQKIIRSHCYRLMKYDFTITDLENNIAFENGV